MVSTETTVDVPADQYNTPEWFGQDTIPVEVTAFSDKVYLDVPDFGRLERRLERHIQSDNDIRYGPDNDRLVSDIDSVEEALDYEFGADGDRVPSRTSQYCLNAGSLFEATVTVSTRRSDPFELEPYMRRYGAVIDGFMDDESIGRHKKADTSDYDEMHLRLLETVASTVAGIEDDDYWLGYKRGDGCNWDGLVWTAFGDMWDGDMELMLDAGVWLASIGMVPCNRTNAFFPIPEWSRPTGSYVATISQFVAGECPGCGANKSDAWEQIYDSGNNARRADKYQCTECGHNQRGITTG